LRPPSHGSLPEKFNPSSSIPFTQISSWILHATISLG
jgi:hypothetical protein